MITDVDRTNLDDQTVTKNKKTTLITPIMEKVLLLVISQKHWTSKPIHTDRAICGMDLDVMEVPYTLEQPASPDRGPVADFEAAVEAAAESLVRAVPEGLTDDAPPLLHAASDRDLEAVLVLLFSWDGLNAEDDDGRTPLHWAVGARDVRLLHCLLALGGLCAPGPPGLRLRLDACDDAGFAALHYSAVASNSLATHALLALGAEADCRGGRGAQTPLMKAARWGDVLQCRQLLDAGADADVADALGRTALQLAAGAGAERVVRLLLERGARPRGADRRGRTALSCALRNRRLGVARLLLPKEAFAPSADEAGRTELHWAAANGTPDVVQRLLRFGPARWPRDNDGMTPLMRALAARNEATAAVLLAAGARGRPCPADRWGLTELHWAARAGLPRLLPPLLAAGCSPWALDAAGRDAFFWAATSGQPEALAALVRCSGSHRHGIALRVEVPRGDVALLNRLRQRADRAVLIARGFKLHCRRNLSRTTEWQVDAEESKTPEDKFET